MKILKTGFYLLVILPILFGCRDKDKDKDKTTPVLLSKDKVTLIIGKTDNVTIKGGNGVYTVTSSDVKIATAKVTKSEMVITAVLSGSAALTVKDGTGKSAKITVSVIKDPNEGVKADAKVRFVYDKTSKIQGTDKGTYLLSHTTTKVEWNWKSEDAKNTVVLSFTNVVGPITEGVKLYPKLLIDGKDVKVTSLEVIQNKVVKTGEKPTIWIVFATDKINGICVGQLNK